MKPENRKSVAALKDFSPFSNERTALGFLIKSKSLNAVMFIYEKIMIFFLKYLKTKDIISKKEN